MSERKCKRIEQRSVEVWDLSKEQALASELDILGLLECSDQNRVKVAVLRKAGKVQTSFIMTIPKSEGEAIKRANKIFNFQNPTGK